MKLVFVSNILNHHQIYLCDEFYKIFDSFKFISTENSKSFGYQTSCKADYTLCYYDLEERPSVLNDLLSADVAIMGSCPNELIALRMQTGKLTFLYSERFLKKGMWRRFIPQTRKKIYDRILKYKDCNIYVLCASAYLSYELKKLHYPVTKCLKWGYFPRISDKTSDEILNLKNSNDRVKILWVGRLISWKHPDDVIKLAQYLLKSNFNFELNIIGDGDLREQIEKSIHIYGLTNCVHLLGSLPVPEVQKYMETANIFLFTSDYKEGWGAVLNEALSNACAVVANHAAGATPFLIVNGFNGMIYANEHTKDMCKIVKFLIENSDERERLGKNGYNTLSHLWNAQVAAERLKHISMLLLGGKSIENAFEEGPCSISSPITHKWNKNIAPN